MICAAGRSMELGRSSCSQLPGRCTSAPAASARAGGLCAVSRFDISGWRDRGLYPLVQGRRGARGKSRERRATAEQSPLRKHCLQKSPLPKDGFASAMERAVTLSLCSQEGAARTLVQTSFPSAPSVTFAGFDIGCGRNRRLLETCGLGSCPRFLFSESFLDNDFHLWF